MVRNILSTAATRLIAGFILIGILALHTKQLGTEILGDITLFKVALTINNLLAAICCGPALVFICNRYKPSEVFLPAFIWILITSCGITGIQFLLGSFPPEFTGWLLFCSVLFGLQVFYENILLSVQKIIWHNGSALLFHVLLLLLTIYMLYGEPVISAYNYIYALAISLGANLLYLVAVTFTTMTYAQSTITTTIIGVLFKNGFWTQLTNFIQTMNYRISVIILARYWGKNAVGYFGACLQLAEAIWIIGKSLAMVQYAKLVSTTDENYQVKFTMLFSRICLLFTVLASVVLLLIPESWMLKVLGNDLKGIILYLYVLIPGIICFSIVPVLSSFYSARGKFHVNTIASAVSLLFISVSAYVLIPDYSVWGAAVVYSSGLAFLMIFYVVLLTARYKVGLVDFIPYKNDLQHIKTIINDYRKKKL